MGAMKGQGQRGVLPHLKRGVILSSVQILLILLLLILNGARPWYFSALSPLLGSVNLAAGWFLHLRGDRFLGARGEEGEEPDSPPPWTGSFLVSGLILLAAATAAYFLAGVGTRYFL